MKTVIRVAMLLFIPGFAAAEAGKTVRALDPKDLQALAEAVKALEAVSDLTPQQLADEEARRQRAAEVAGTVMDLGAQALAPVVARISETSPELWRTMVRRQYTKAAERLVLPFGMFLFSLCLWSVAGRLRKWVGTPLLKDQEASGLVQNAVGIAAGYGLPLLIVYSFLVPFLYQLSQSVGFVANPEFYAFQDLLIALLRRGAGA